MDLEKNKIYLIYKKLSGTLTQDEERSFAQWLEENPENQKHVERIQEILNHSQNDMEYPPVDKEEIWHGITKETIHKTAGRTSLKSLLSPFAVKNPMVRFATGFAVILCCVGTYLLFHRVLNPYQVTKTGMGQQISLSLPDQSQIVLNSDSEIKFKKDFSEKHRTLSLKGEAYFKVAHQETPFIIETEYAKTTVLGTTFNLYSRDLVTQLFVDEGKVKFQSLVENDASVIVTAGQFSSVDQGEQPKKPVKMSTKKALAWLDKKLIFERAPLEDVAKVLERHYNIRIKFQQEPLKKRTITATIHDLNADEAIQSLCAILKITYSKKSNQYLLKNKEKQE